MSPSAGITGPVNPEALKDKGQAFADAALGAANDVVRYAAEMNSLHPIRTDEYFGLKASVASGTATIGSVLSSFKAEIPPLAVPAATLATLKKRFVGRPEQFLLTVYNTVTRYETFKDNLDFKDSVGDYRLSNQALAFLRAHKGVTAEAYTDPLAAHPESSFCGLFSDVDVAFGGLAPFGKEGGGGEAGLCKRGGSVACIPPLDHTLAANYMRKILERIYSSKNRMPLSFFVVLPSQCFRNRGEPGQAELSEDDLKSLDTRLVDGKNSLVRRVCRLPAGRHCFRCPGLSKLASEVIVPSASSLFVLIQNDAGCKQHRVVDEDIRKLFGFMTPAGAEPASVSSIAGGVKAAIAAAATVPPTVVGVAATESSSFSGGIIPMGIPMQGIGGGVGAVLGAPQQQTTQVSPPQLSSSLEVPTLGSWSSTGDLTRGKRLGRHFDLVESDDEGEEIGGGDIGGLSGSLGRLPVMPGLPGLDGMDVSGMGGIDDILGGFGMMNGGNIDIESFAVGELGLTGGAPATTEEEAQDGGRRPWMQN
jgi:hypothetical protein